MDKTTNLTRFAYQVSHYVLRVRVSLIPLLESGAVTKA